MTTRHIRIAGAVLASGLAAVETGAEGVRPIGAAVSATDPQAWHSPQRPTHFPVSQPHSEQR